MAHAASSAVGPMTVERAEEMTVEVTEYAEVEGARFCTGICELLTRNYDAGVHETLGLSWTNYCKTRFGKNKTWAYKLIQAARERQRLGPLGTKLTNNVAAAISSRCSTIEHEANAEQAEAEAKRLAAEVQGMSEKQALTHIIGVPARGKTKKESPQDEESPQAEVIPLHGPRKSPQESPQESPQTLKETAASVVRSAIPLETGGYRVGGDELLALALELELDVATVPAESPQEVPAESPIYMDSDLGVSSTNGSQVQTQISVNGDQEDLDVVGEGTQEELPGANGPREVIRDAWLSEPGMMHHREAYFVDKALCDLIARRVQTYGADDVATAIHSYAFVVGSPEHYFNHRWTLRDFLQRGLEKFVPEAEPEKVFVNNRLTKGQRKDARVRKLTAFIDQKRAEREGVTP